ncbi:PiggyBac transposable element-derived protein 4-like Protein [Elysia marginata]|uniref:PiggyBac transposable element-derived protein 4-like Protein n=1 Tax=Elysia marginata TaxID=1093978 RepID=A0AAV4ENB8_9GAST|nr:PiggyBac transposable element-derived protein 4-like Protein [Elysia marginata]
MSTHTTRTETKAKPDAVIDYTSNMSGVDQSDQLISYNPLHRKTVKWWKKLAFHLITLCVVQSHIILNKARQLQRKRPLQLECFMRKLCLALAKEGKALEEEPESEEGVPVPSTSGSELGRLTGRHFPVPCEENRKRGVCTVCYEKLKKSGADAKALKQSQKTYYKCGQCQKSLCVFPCFTDYHTKQDFTI